MKPCKFCRGSMNETSSRSSSVSIRYMVRYQCSECHSICTIVYEPKEEVWAKDDDIERIKFF